MIPFSLNLRGEEQLAVYLTPQEAKALANGRHGVAEIKHMVARFYGVPQAMLEHKDRRVEFSKPRQIAMYLAREVAGKSYMWIAGSFHRDHTTVLHAYRRVSAHVAKGEKRDEVAREIAELRRRLGA